MANRTVGVSQTNALETRVMNALAELQSGKDDLRDAVAPMKAAYARIDRAQRELRKVMERQKEVA